MNGMPTFFCSDSIFVSFVNVITTCGLTAKRSSMFMSLWNSPLIGRASSLFSSSADINSSRSVNCLSALTSFSGASLHTIWHGIGCNTEILVISAGKVIFLPAKSVITRVSDTTVSDIVVSCSIFVAAVISALGFDVVSITSFVFCEHPLTRSMDSVITRHSTISKLNGLFFVLILISLQYFLSPSQNLRFTSLDTNFKFHATVSMLYVLQDITNIIFN